MTGRYTRPWLKASEGNSRPAALNAWVKVRLLGRKYSSIPAGMEGLVDENPWG